VLGGDLVVSQPHRLGQCLFEGFFADGGWEAGRTRGYASRTLHWPAAGSRPMRSQRTQEHRRIDGLLARVLPPGLRRARVAPRPRSRHRTREPRATGPRRR
jgi:hypothetical protein